MSQEFNDDICKCGCREFITIKSTTKGCWLQCAKCERIFYHKWRSKGLSQCECEG